MKKKSNLTSFLHLKKASLKKQENTKTQSVEADYRSYKLSGLQTLITGAVWTGCSICLGLLFYRSLIPAVLLMGFLPLIIKVVSSKLCELRRLELTREFSDGISLYANALLAGYSPENGIKEAEKDLMKIYGGDALLTVEFAGIRRRISIGENIEEALSDLARRSAVKDIEDMAGIFAISKRSGGSLPALLRECGEMLREKNRIRDEIETMLTAKKLEQRLMCLMPAGILLYVNLTCDDFILPLYEGLAGRVIMTVFLLLYVLMVYVGEKIMKIKV